MLVEWRLDAVVNLCGLEDLALLGVVADGQHAHDAVALHGLGALHDVVGGIGGVGVGVGGVGALGAHRFAGQRRFVHVQVDGLDQLAVGGHLLAGIDDDEVAHDDVAAGHLRELAIAIDLDGLVVIDLVEEGKLLVGLPFEVEGQTGGQQDGHEDAGGLEEHFGAMLKAEELVERDADGQGTGDEEHDDERVGKLAEELFPQRLFLGRGEHVAAILLAAGSHLGVSQAGVLLLFFHVNNVFSYTIGGLQPAKLAKRFVAGLQRRAKCAWAAGSNIQAGGKCLR